MAHSSNLLALWYILYWGSTLISKLLVVAYSKYLPDFIIFTKSFVKQNRNISNYRKNENLNLQSHCCYRKFSVGTTCIYYNSWTCWFAMSLNSVSTFHLLILFFTYISLTVASCDLPMSQKIKSSSSGISFSFYLLI